MVLGALSWTAFRPMLLRHYEPRFLTTGSNGAETPGTEGIPYERLTIPSHSRKLDAYLVRAP